MENCPMADLPEPPPHDTPQLGWCLALYPRLSRRARRRMAALLVAAALLAQPLAGYARGDRETGAVGGNFHSPIVQLAPPTLPGDAPSGGSGGADPYANPAVARALVALGLDVPAASSALDATPTGSEFQVNTFTTSEQRRPSVAIDDDGDFVVVWQSYGSGGTDTSYYSIQGQRYNAAGSAVGSQFQVNTYTTGIQGIPSVAMDADGDFVVVWESYGSGGTDISDRSIQGQRYNAAGSAVGSEFQINTYTTNDQRDPSVAIDADGDFVVVWMSQGSGGTDTDGFSVQGQRYTAAGTAVGGEFQINTYTTLQQRTPSVAMDADGDFVVVWETGASGGTDSTGYSVQGQRYNAAGSAVGSQFQVNTYTTDRQRRPSVAMDDDGDFVVAWHSRGSSGTDTSLYGIQGQRYSAAGSAAGSEFQVNTYTTSEQRYPTVAMDADGDFVIVWQSFGSSGTDTDAFSIQGQRYNAAGTAQGSEFQVNTYTTGRQRYPSVATDADGDFMGVWESLGSGGTDTDAYSIQAQRYLSANPAIPPAPTAVDLRYFRVIGLADRAILVWETAAETDTLGFNVLRGASAEGPWTPVNAAPIPAEGGAASGHSYILRDAPGSGTWHYRLEEISAGGKRGAHPVGGVRVGSGAEGRALFVPKAEAGP
jgi:hypothetical protein